MAGINIDNRFSPSTTGPWWRRCFSTMLAGIVTVNVLVFLVVSGTDALARFNLAPWLGMLGPVEIWINRPWGLLTYMFVQTDILHLLFNMIWLWGFGTLMLRFDGPGILLRTYLAGGIGGALCFLLLTSLPFSSGVSLLVVSSASIMGVIAGAAARQPRIKVGLVFFGQVELRVLALIAIVLLGIVPGIGNFPTLAAHIGGALSGWAFIALTFRKKKSSPASYHANKKKSHLTQVRAHQRRGLSEEQQREMDELLAKVKAKGYKNLTDSEKQRLFNISSYIKE